MRRNPLRAIILLRSCPLLLALLILLPILRLVRRVLSLLVLVLLSLVLFRRFVRHLISLVIPVGSGDLWHSSLATLLFLVWHGWHGSCKPRQPIPMLRQCKD